MVCYESKKPSHIKYDCPLFKSGKFKKKAMKVTWDDSYEGEFEEEENEVANMFFMEIINAKVTNSSSSHSFDDLDDLDDKVDESPTYKECT